MLAFCVTPSSWVNVVRITVQVQLSIKACSMVLDRLGGAFRVNWLIYSVAGGYFVMRMMLLRGKQQYQHKDYEGRDGEIEQEALTEHCGALH